MLLVKGGEFMMGSEDGRYDEKPIHKVRLNDFYLGTNLVTVEEFEVFIEATGYQTDAEKQGSSQIYIEDKWQGIPGVNWRCDTSGKPHVVAEYRHPVIHISWNDAVTYCAWLKELTGQEWRLTTEAEWEYAAGGGSQNRTKWAGTDKESELGDYAWYSKNGDGQTHSVGEKMPNTLGFFDMSGNAWEWCSDWHGAYLAVTGINPKGPILGSSRVFRGGGWFGDPDYCRVANRSFGDPLYCGNGIGFRLARSL
jgi:formylglycine-generating enzyme required for sulfatase activity